MKKQQVGRRTNDGKESSMQASIWSLARVTLKTQHMSAANGDSQISVLYIHVGI
jgi:hypothetical protein